MRTLARAQVFHTPPPPFFPLFLLSLSKGGAFRHTHARTLFKSAGRSTRSAFPGGSCPLAPRHTLLPGMLRGHAKQEGGARGGTSQPAQVAPRTSPSLRGQLRSRPPPGQAHIRRQFLGTLGETGPGPPCHSPPPGQASTRVKRGDSKGRAHACSRVLPSVSQSVSLSSLALLPRRYRRRRRRHPLSVAHLPACFRRPFPLRAPHPPPPPPPRDRD